MTSGSKRRMLPYFTGARRPGAGANGLQNLLASLQRGNGQQQGNNGQRPRKTMGSVGPKPGNGQQGRNRNPRTRQGNTQRNSQRIPQEFIQEDYPTNLPRGKRAKKCSKNRYCWYAGLLIITTYITLQNGQEGFKLNLEG